jgi:hypothetical protein
MDKLEIAQQAGNYFQTFTRSNIASWGELMRGVNPHEGYGNSVEASRAWHIAMALFDWADTHCVNVRVPENYASADDLREMLLSFAALLDEWRGELDEDWHATRARDFILETIPMVREAVVKARHGVTEALRQLEPALSSPSGAADQNIVALLQQVADRFDQVLARLKKRRSPRQALTMVDEYDVQYLFEALLALHLNDIRPQEPGPTVGGGSSRADTFLPKQRCVVEYKMTRASVKNNNVKLRQELADDFVLYGEDTRCDVLFVFVHDPGRHVDNPIGFEAQLSVPRTGLPRVRVVVR